MNDVRVESGDDVPDTIRADESGGTDIKTVLTALILAGVAMALLGLVRVPFAVRFWQRMQWVAWVYIAVVIIAAVRLAWLS